MRRYACICCEVLFREFCQAATKTDAILDFIPMPQGLHNTPDYLRTRLQQEIKRLEDGLAHATPVNSTAHPSPTYDAILLGYALCSNGIIGLSSTRFPLVIPRGHDCITLLLGSKERYQEYFDNHQGVYWYSSGWIERALQPGRERLAYLQQQYTERYGEEDANFLLEAEEDWYRKYGQATYIDWGVVTSARDREYTKDCAEFLGWRYDEVQGDPQLMIDFLQGTWDDNRFLVVQPGHCIEPSYDPTIIKACPGCKHHRV